jgi:hypothetical protein
MRVTFFIAFFEALALAGCGTGGGGKPSAPTSTSVSGDAGGQSFVVKDALGIYDTAREVSGAFITNFPESCTLLQSGMRAPPSTQLLAIELIANGLGMAPGPGTYTLGKTQNVAIVVSYVASDANCNETTNEQATAGSVTLDSVGATVTGTFDLAFANGDRLSGQFDTPVCNIDITNLGANAGACDGGGGGGDQ